MNKQDKQELGQVRTELEELRQDFNDLTVELQDMLTVWRNVNAVVIVIKWLAILGGALLAVKHTAIDLLDLVSHYFHWNNQGE